MTQDQKSKSNRRIPQQPRSRKKVADLLETAMRLFRDTGMDQVSMREIARASDMPIATVYQYFPNKQAIVKTIWENYTAAIGELLQSELETIQNSRSFDSVSQVIDRIVDRIANYHHEHPSFLEIRWCVDASPDLRQLNLDDTLKVANLIRDVILVVNPDADRGELTNYAMIATETTSSTIRLAHQLQPNERDALLQTLKSSLLQFYRGMATNESNANTKNAV